MTTRYFDFSDQTSRLGESVTRFVASPWHLLQRSAQAVERRRKAAQVRADLASLDPHLLADIGLRRSLIDPARLCEPPCG
ncbi:MAG TPA: DUF1127 domain-containing protein [Alphaproteobacteria bacterium]